MRGRHLTALIAVAASFAYAIVRYHLYKGVPWSELPLYISNKALALSAIVLIALSYIVSSLAKFWPNTFGDTFLARKFFGLTGFGLAALHSALSLVNLIVSGRAKYPAYFDAAGAVTEKGWFAIGFGAVSFLLFSAVASTSLPFIGKNLSKERWHTIQRLGYLGLIFALLHVGVMGLAGWQAPETWPGGLLPISLIAALTIVVALVLRIVVVTLRKQ